ncbi:DUF1275 domain protein [Cordyceps fumosorosea ARSEF 2679]|uniref:DUF1275 domain protein n=1 Tax=Cordyceps fumosorosea (strain ARSEF 2679) TaxID=1081104 RepID=A0A167V285_CORFA|nr:DUF1275 domain protein [Cordyceps fumosorosea ARSEF 2679]OAA62148.1 DUF1275 domain protein [Cordyceps fumosorosea ARSEF 2679]
MAGLYGTANGHHPDPRRTGPDAERQPLLGKPSSPRASGLAGLRRTLKSNVTRDWADLMLLFCYVVTGLLDSASTQVWGAFVSMQTGNTVYVALGIASLIYPPISPRLYRSGASLLSFCVGSLLFARFQRSFGATRRWVLCASFLAQTALAALAALVVTLTPPPAGDGDAGWTVLLPVVLVSLQASGQAVASRALRHNALTSVVLTSIYCDLFSDQRLFSRDNVERNRRAAAPLLLLLGAVAGGVFAHSPVGIEGALWTAAALKLVMVGIWSVWPEDEAEDEE